MVLIDELLILLFLLLFFIIVIFVFLVPFKTRDTTPSDVSIVGGMNYSCRFGPCETGFTCDPATSLCKFPDGTPCVDATECITSHVCSGVCVPGPYGGLKEPCPCNPGLLCVEKSGGELYCLGEGGFPCTDNSDCASNICNNGFCTAGFPNGFPCDSNASCTSNNCSLNFCQPAGVTSGMNNAVCVSLALPPYNPGPKPSPGCDPGFNCISSVCSANNVGLGGVCSSNNICAEALFCDNAICLYRNNLEYNTCPTFVCSGGDSVYCNSSSFNCSGASNSQCTINSSCFSNVCNNNIQGLYSRFITGSNTILGAKDIGFDLLATSLLFFTRLTGFGSNIYASSGNGLYILNNGSWSLVLASPIITSIPGGTNVKVLTSATITPTLRLLAFAETQTVGSDIITNDTLYILNNDNTITPYNVISTPGNLDGTQYTTSNIPLLIDDFDISVNNDIAIVSAGSLYTKTINETIYTYRNVNNAVYVAFYNSSGSGNSINNYGYTVNNSGNFRLVITGDISLILPNNDLTQRIVIGDFDFNDSPNLQNGVINYVTLGPNILEPQLNVYINGVNYIIPGTYDVNNAILADGVYNLYLLSAGICS